MYCCCTSLQYRFCACFPNNQLIWDCELAQGSTGMDEIQQHERPGKAQALQSLCTAQTSLKSALQTRPILLYQKYWQHGLLYPLQKAPKPALAYSGNQQVSLPCSGDAANSHRSTAMSTVRIIVTTVNLRSAGAHLITDSTIYTSNVSDMKKTQGLMRTDFPCFPYKQMQMDTKHVMQFIIPFWSDLH